MLVRYSLSWEFVQVPDQLSMVSEKERTRAKHELSLMIFFFMSLSVKHSTQPGCDHASVETSKLVKDSAFLGSGAKLMERVKNTEEKLFVSISRV